MELLILPLSFLLDMILGDPPYAHHPIRYMGKAIERLEPRFRRLADTGRLPNLFVSGALFALILIVAVFGLTLIVVFAAQMIHPVCRIILEVILIYFCISARSLESAALEVYDALRSGNLKEAKQRLALIVGRDTEPLSEEATARAAVETVAENLVDGVIAPLFFAAVGGAPLAMAYKMVNTLDSMIGYKNERYKDFGKAGARIDDIANFIPARLSVPIISLAAQILGRNGRNAFRTAIAEGANHSSPNAGYPEAAFAGALGVKLGGPNYYQGNLVAKPYIGEDLGEMRVSHIRKACNLMLLSSFFCLGALVVLMM